MNAVTRPLALEDQNIREFSDQDLNELRMITSSTGAAIFPSGPESDRPDPAQHEGKFLVRGNADTGKLEWYDWGAQKWKNIGSGSGELFEFGIHNGPRSTIPRFHLPYDGQKIYHADNPQLCEAIWAGRQHAVDDAQWAANKNKWSRGDGTTWVRAPNLNMADGSEKPFYLRGGPESVNGTWVGDAIRPFEGSVGGVFSSSAGSGTGIMRKAPATGNAGNNAGTATGYTTITIDTAFDPNLPTADENRVKTANIVYIFRAFSDVENAGSIDAAQLATQLAAVDAAVQTLDSSIGFTIIYPNGGTEAAPANVSTNSRYVMANPFPGHYVLMEVQILVDGVWANPGWDGDSGSGSVAIGVRAGMANGDCVIQTAASALMLSSNRTGGLHGYVGTSNTTPRPCRVLCWKSKGVM